MIRDNLTQTLKSFDRGDRLSIAQLKYLIKNLWAKHYATSDLLQKQKWKDKAEEVQAEIDFWAEIEKNNPFASFEKYTR